MEDEDGIFVSAVNSRLGVKEQFQGSTHQLLGALLVSVSAKTQNDMSARTKTQ